MAWLGLLFQSLLSGCNQGINLDYTHFKAQLGENLLLNALMWLLAGFSSSRVIGLNSLVVVDWRPLSSLPQGPRHKTGHNMATGFCQSK